MQRKTYGLSRLTLREGERGAAVLPSQAGAGHLLPQGAGLDQEGGGQRGIFHVFKRVVLGFDSLRKERSRNEVLRIFIRRFGCDLLAFLFILTSRFLLHLFGPVCQSFPFGGVPSFLTQQVHPPVVLGQQVLAWYRSTRPIPVEVHPAELIPSPCPTPLALVMAGNKPSFLKIVMKTSVPRVMNPGDFSFPCGSACTEQRKKTGQNERLYETGHDFIIEKTLGKWQVFRKNFRHAIGIRRDDWDYW